MSIKKQVYIACVTGQYNCERIISAASCIARDADAQLEIVSVLSGSCRGEELAAIDYLYSVAKSVDSPMTVLFNDNPVLAVTEYVSRKKAAYVITGVPGENNKGFISLLSAVLPKVRIISIPDVTTSDDDDYMVEDLFELAAGQRA